MCCVQGSGKNSRHSQMVVALCDKPGCRTSALGKADWEVPVGTVRRQGFGTLVDIERSGFPYPRLEMRGQDPHAAGPDQMRIRTDPDYLAKEFPFVQHWEGCRVVERALQGVRRPLYLDHATHSLTEGMYSRFPKMELRKNQHKFVEMMVVVNGDNDGGKSHNLAQRVVIEVAVIITLSSCIASYYQSYLFNHIFSVWYGQVIPEWAPLGAQRFVDLVNSLYFDGASFFRVLKVCQDISDSRHVVFNWLGSLYYVGTIEIHGSIRNCGVS
jgi:hypothetical protein